jgi:hypothetical protein
VILEGAPAVDFRQPPRTLGGEPVDLALQLNQVFFQLPIPDLANVFAGQFIDYRT